MLKRTYLDEHVHPAVAAGLRRRGVDVQTTSEADLRGASDLDQLKKATESGRVLFTQDADLLRLHARGESHAGIAYARQQTPVGTLVRGLLLIYQLLEAGEMHNHVEFL